MPPSKKGTKGKSSTSDAKKSSQKAKTPPAIVITLTLPHATTVERSGTMMITRGSLGTMRQFTYRNPVDLAEVIRAGVLSLNKIEMQPPAKATKPAAKAETPAASNPPAVASTSQTQGAEAVPPAPQPVESTPAPVQAAVPPAAVQTPDAQPEVATVTPPVEAVSASLATSPAQPEAAVVPPVKVAQTPVAPAPTPTTPTPPTPAVSLEPPTPAPTAVASIPVVETPPPAPAVETPAAPVAPIAIPPASPVVEEPAASALVMPSPVPPSASAPQSEPDYKNEDDFAEDGDDEAQVSSDIDPNDPFWATAEYYADLAAQREASGSVQSAQANGAAQPSLF